MREVLEVVEFDSAIGKSRDHFSGSGLISHRGFSSQELDTKARARFHIPNAKGIVVTPRNDAPAIGAQDEGIDQVCMALEDIEALASLDIPNAKGVVVAP